MAALLKLKMRLPLNTSAGRSCLLVEWQPTVSCWPWRLSATTVLFCGLPYCCITAIATASATATASYRIRHHHHRLFQPSSTLSRKLGAGRSSESSPVPCRSCFVCADTCFGKDGSNIWSIESTIPSTPKPNTKSPASPSYQGTTPAAHRRRLCSTTNPKPSNFAKSVDVRGGRGPGGRPSQSQRCRVAGSAQTLLVNSRRLGQRHKHVQIVGAEGVLEWWPVRV